MPLCLSGHLINSDQLLPSRALSAAFRHCYGPKPLLVLGPFAQSPSLTASLGRAGIPCLASYTRLQTLFSRLSIKNLASISSIEPTEYPLTPSIPSWSWLLSASSPCLKPLPHFLPHPILFACLSKRTSNTVKLAATQLITRLPPSTHFDRPYSPPTPSLRTHHSSNVDISLLLKPKDARPGEGEDERGRSSSTSPAAKSTASLPSLPSTIATSVTGSANPHSNPHVTPSAPPLRTSPSPSNLRPQPQSLKRAASTAELPTASPAKKQSKWSPDEDSKIIQLRGEGMKWEDISKHLPGRSAISCRLHYQNYLERRSEWDEDRKNKLARLYERFKADMWSRIAEEMAIPWRAAEAMHWQMGEHEMARRAGVTPFTLANTNNNSHSLGVPRHYNQLPPNMLSSAGSHHLRRNSNPNSTSMTYPLTHTLSQPGSQSGQPQQLPSLAELTAGLPAFASPHHQQPPSHHLTSNPLDALSPYSEYPHSHPHSRRSLPPGGHPSGTAFDHLPPPGSLSGYPRPGSPAAGGPGLAGSYFPTSAPTAGREMNGRR